MEKIPNPLSSQEGKHSNPLPSQHETRPLSHQPFLTQFQNLRFEFSDAFPPREIFHYFTQVKLIDFLDEIEFTTSSEYFEDSFRLTTFNFTDIMSLKSSNYYQFHFKNRKIHLTGYLFKTAEDDFPTGWKLEISPNEINWTIISV